MASSQDKDVEEQPWFLRSKTLVDFPEHQALDMPDDEFEAFIKREIAGRHNYSDANLAVNSSVLPNEEFNATRLDVEAEVSKTDIDANTDINTFTVVDAAPSTTADVREALETVELDSVAAHEMILLENPALDGMPEENSNRFMAALLRGFQPQDQVQSQPNMDNKMFTENNDLALRSTGNALVDLFHELEEVVSGPRLLELLNAAWAADPEITLKIIFNARSIHLGKASRKTFYRAAGWLAVYHPLTLMANLRWLSRPVIQKKADKKPAETGDGAEDSAVLVDRQDALDENDPAYHDVRNGVAHGYWKDLLNMLALAANNKLSPLTNIDKVLNVDARKKRALGAVTQSEAKTKKRELEEERHRSAVDKFNTDPVYRALHLTVARLFAAQLKEDLAKLRSGDPKAMRQVSLCAKWAPSAGNFHDRHTFVVSSIAELLAPKMVRRVFVFSDMHFDAADRVHRRLGPTERGWASSYERIRGLYGEAGYELPEMVFWNLAGGRAGVTGRGDPTAPKPVGAEVEGVTLVSGYSQGMLKVFLDGAGFGGPEEVVEDEEEGFEMLEKGEGEEGGQGGGRRTKKRKLDPLGLVKRAVGHKAYSVLKVVD